METFRNYITTLLLVLAFVTSYSQDVRTIRPFQYTQNNGLSSHYVTKIIQDQYGFLWIGTQEGLNVFDGTSFEKFSKQSVLKHNIGGSLVEDLAEDKKRSTLWILSAYSDICALDLTTRTIKKKISKDHNGRSFSEQWIRSIHLQGDTLWIGGLNTLSAYNVQTNSFLNIDEIEKKLIGNTEYNLSRIFSDKLGRTWLLNEGSGIVVVDKTLRIIKTFDLVHIDGLRKQKLLFWDGLAIGDHLYVASSWGLLHFHNGSENEAPSQVKDIASAFLQTEIRSLAFAPPSKLLLSTARHFYVTDLTTKKITVLEDENRENDGFSAVFQTHYDRTSDKVWIGTLSGLSSFSLSEGPFSAFSKSRSGNQKLKHLYTLLPISTNEVYAGGDNGIFYIDTRSREIVNIDTASANLLLFQDKKKNVFVSNTHGFYIIKGKNVFPVRRLDSRLERLERDHFISAVQYNDSLILLASVIQRGLTMWNTRSNSIATYHNDSLHHAIPGLQIINYLYKGRSENVFIITEKSIIRFNPITRSHVSCIVKKKDSDEVITNFMDMCETDSSYWLATYGNGIIETDKNFRIKNAFTTASGLGNNCIYRIFNLNGNSILATSNYGLSLLQQNPYSIKNYFWEDGLHGDGFEQLCGFQHDGKIFVGGLGGFTIVDPSLIYRDNKVPALYLKSIRIDTQSGNVDSCNLHMTKCIIPNNALQTTVSFVAINYNNPGRIIYKYKITELGNEWIDIGNQNFVNLIGLSPGMYTFQVIACNEDGIATMPREIKLEFLPKWYQAIWFKFIVLMIGITLIYFTQRYRLSQIHKQQQIRKEIANDLHDDIGSTLNSLKIFAHLAKHESDNRERVLQIEESVSKATVGLRDVIWVLDDDQDSVHELMERIKKFALPVCLANNINLVTQIQALTDKMISKKIKRNILLIAKECINNSIKYSSCSNMYITLHHTKVNLKLVIEDDGIGFNMNSIIPGKGLGSIQYRAKQIQFECKIVSESRRGTKIELSSKGYSRWQIPILR